jgi:DNA-binding GntR family transcriptional regulator
MAPGTLDQIYAQAKTDTRSNPAVIADALTHAILHGLIPAGAPLRQSELASGFGVSQTPVREALKLICDTGLARAEPNRGVAVRELAAEEAREITDLRVMLECDALARAIPSYTQADLENLALINRKLSRARRIDNIVELNTAFHSALYEPSQRQTTLELIAKLRIRFERYLRFVWKISDHLEYSNAEHTAILEHAAKRQPDEARELLAAHIEATGNVIAMRLTNEPHTLGETV